MIVGLTAGTYKL